jgi:hypothetical protein
MNSFASWNRPVFVHGTHPWGGSCNDSAGAPADSENGFKHSLEKTPYIFADADTMSPFSLTESIGCWLRERWQAEMALNRVLSGFSGSNWLDLCNRRQKTERDPVSGGRVCVWTNSSLLTAARIFPGVGARLLQKCLAEWPIRFADPSRFGPPQAGTSPRISFILPVGGGSARIPQFRLSAASLLAQVDCPLEIIVVEYSVKSCFGAEVPKGCTYHHLPAAPQVDGYNKSAAMNAGVRLAKADVVVLLDADMVVPERLAAWLTERFDHHPDLAAMRFARLIFYVGEADSREMDPEGALRVPKQIKFVNQNTPMPLAVRKSAYEEIGGHDEAFVGWGGEDIEFLSRLRTLRCSEGGRVPIVHIWHPSAPQKANGHYNSDLLARTLQIPPEVRIAELRGNDSSNSQPRIPFHKPGCLT